MNQQNTAQEGRQNNNCGNSNNATLVVRGGDARGACANKNASDSSHTLTRNGGSTARGGSGGSNLNEQTTAQEGGQNNNCDNSNLGDIEVTGGALSDTCVNKDVSRNRYTLTRNGGARAEGGSSGAGLIANQQTTAQEGGQNNNCDNTDNTFLPLDGSRESTACLNKDASRNDHTVTKRGGARVEGGSSVGNLNQQNTAQEGQQNNDCANSNFGDVEVTQGALTHSARTSIVPGMWTPWTSARCPGGRRFQRGSAVPAEHRAGGPSEQQLRQLQRPDPQRVRRPRAGPVCRCRPIHQHRFHHLLR